MSGDSVQDCIPVPFLSSGIIVQIPDRNFFILQEINSHMRIECVAIAAAMPESTDNVGVLL